MTDPELDRNFIKFLCAYYFHWTPEQVERTDNYDVEFMLEALPAWKKKEADAMGGR